ncbi:hypothetical protein J6590_014492 [Homalodisca vitripennis]|nr:hypothetical protein J6590_014492 [Homalodisca vitripennis]
MVTYHLLNYTVLKLRFPSSAIGLAACYVIKAKCAACLVEAHLNTALRKSVFLGFVILRSVTRDLTLPSSSFILKKKCTVFIDMDRKRNVLAKLLLFADEEMDEDVDIAVTLLSTRGSCSELFKRRKSEGAYNVLITKHLIDNEVKFKEYFRLTRDQFFSLLGLVGEEITVKPYNRVIEPITAEMKLAVTLRYYLEGCFSFGDISAEQHRCCRSLR